MLPCQQGPGAPLLADCRASNAVGSTCCHCPIASHVAWRQLLLLCWRSVTIFGCGVGQLSKGCCIPHPSKQILRPSVIVKISYFTVNSMSLVRLLFGGMRHDRQDARPFPAVLRTVDCQIFSPALLPLVAHRLAPSLSGSVIPRQVAPMPPHPWIPPTWVRAYHRQQQLG